MNYKLIQLNPLRLLHVNLGGLPASLSRESDPPQTPDGYAYVEDEAFPVEEPSEGKQWVRNLTAESYGWIEQDVLEEEPEWYEIPAWRIRAVAKVTPFGDGMLMDAVDVAIAAIVDPVEKAVAEEVFYRGNTLRRDSALLTTMATGLGLTDAALDGLFSQAYAIEV